MTKKGKANIESVLAKYEELLKKIDEKFHYIQSRYPEVMNCRTGCFDCCAAGLTISLVEKENIKRFLLSNASARKAAAQLVEENPHGGKYCSFLKGDGSCTIYEARPILCRAHGVPTKVPSEQNADEVELDVCPLNFKGFDLEVIEEDAFIVLETINTILALINHHYDPKRSLKRTRLELDPIIK